VSHSDEIVDSANIRSYIIYHQTPTKAQVVNLSLCFFILKCRGTESNCRHRDFQFASLVKTDNPDYIQLNSFRLRGHT
jgi:hypothetical protein